MRILAVLALCFSLWAQTATQPAPARRSLSDAAGTNRYAAENAALAAPRPGEDRVVFMGDSITDFWGRRAGKFFPGKPYVNRGISGQLTNQMLLRFRPDVIALKPRVVVILGGTNDIGGSLGPLTPQETRDDIMSMVDLARANGIGVVLSSLLPVSDAYGPQSDKRPPEKLRALNEWMREYASREKIVYLDYWSAMLDDKGMLRSEFTADGLHPNDAGYAVMEPLAAKAIKTSLGGR